MTSLVLWLTLAARPSERVQSSGGCCGLSDEEWPQCVVQTQHCCSKPSPESECPTRAIVLKPEALAPFESRSNLKAAPS